MTTRELNRRIKAAVVQGVDEIIIKNPSARHNIAVGIRQPCKIAIEGSVGYYAASQLDGPEVSIDGNAGWALGENLMNGTIALSKNAGASVGASMRGCDVSSRETI